MAIAFLEKYGVPLGGIAAVLGALLAASLCLMLQGSSIQVKPGQEQLLWLILSVSGAAYHFARSGGRGASGGYTHPLLGAALNLAIILPFAGLALSWLGLQPGAGAAGAFLEFMDSIAVLFVAVLFFSGVGSVMRFLRPAPISSQ